MLNNNFTGFLLGLKDVIIENVTEQEKNYIIDLKMKQRIHNCPACGSETSKIHDYRTQLVKHVPLGCFPIVLRLRKRRYVCPHCGKRFNESISFLPKFQRTTNSLWGYVLDRLTYNVSMKDIALQTNLSQSTIARILDFTSFKCTELPKNISIDEFRGNSGGEKFQCILTNPHSKKVLDILPSRKSDSLCEYFSNFKMRRNVETVTMDLSSLFRNVAKACFPNAKIVADKFHAQRLATNAMESIRKKEQQNFGPGRRKYFKRSKTLLLKHKDLLTPQELDTVANMLSLSKPLAQAYELKELAYSLFDSEDVHTAKKRMLSFRMAAGVSNLKEFERVSNTYVEWENEIINIFETKLSNGYTEGCNNRIKVIKRTAYGMRNFTRFRKRILMEINK